MEKSNLNPKSPTKDRNAYFSSPHLTHDQPNKFEPHHSGLRALDHEVNDFDAYNKYFNQVSNNDSIQKVTINRVSPLLNMDTEHKHKHNPEQGDITKSTRSFSYSASSSLGVGGGNRNNMIMMNNHKAHSFHAATSTPPPPSSSKSTLNNKAGLLFHHPQKPTTISATKPPHQTSSNLTKKLRTSLSKPIWLLRRKCPCNDRKSVQVKGNTNTNTNKNTPKAKTPTTPQPQTLSHKHSLNHKTKSNKEVKSQSQRLFQFQSAMNQARRPTSEGFTFPLFLASNSNNPTKPHHQVLLNVVHEEEDTTPRESLHVFQPPSPPKSRAMDDDAASDASSDLFEIESFSTQTTTYPIITPSSISQCHQTTDHEFFFAADAGSSGAAAAAEGY
ncbi:protein PHYTOCHROME KINASE SUBSTRATE 4 [Cajanus cajan]|uniref:protein PHYTOCHROME KINASE SUBSTRATE 4 n=1 Tax=Cajanus cajan TaxID=3821 RepID=UPI00098DBDEB|nr:protein PHYTOCHROME KINASE SUBSTRATE 4 [Cajanus cajan]